MKDIAGETFVLGPEGCGLVAITRGLFNKVGARLKEYSGQALSYQVMQDWTDIGIGATILPMSKLAPHFRERARRIMVQPKRPALVAFDALWIRQTAHPRHVAQLHAHFLDCVPKLVQGSARR